MFEPLAFKYAMGVLSVIIALIAYAIYAWQTLKGQTRPHPLSWAIFGVLTGTGFWIQWDERAGPGSWVMAVTASICFVLCIASAWKGERKFPWFEWAFLFASGFVFVFYFFSKRPDTAIAAFTSVIGSLGFDSGTLKILSANLKDALDHNGAAISAILATVVDVIGYGPTLTKGWTRPHSDSVTSFALNSLKFIPSLFAMISISIATCVYPATLIVVNAAVAIMLILRRRRVANIRRARAT